VAAARELLDALGEISAPLLQRIFRIGYGSACLVIEKLSQKEFVLSRLVDDEIECHPTEE
jgi:hypothetical protein